MPHSYATHCPTLVVKYGGNAFAGNAADDPVLAEIAQLHRAGARVVLVHGGGPEIDAALVREGIESTRVDGLRVTDARTLELTESVLCGTINKRLVRAAASLGVHAAGVSGEDGGLLVARAARARSGASLGYVGEIVATDPALLHLLLDGGTLPIVAPLAIARDGMHAYNVNADLAAAAIAAALRADAFVALTNVARVLRDANDPASGIDAMTVDDADRFRDTDACGAGMRPKIAAAAAAVRGGCTASFICAAGPGAIADAIERGNATRITSAHVSRSPAAR